MPELDRMSGVTYTTEQALVGGDLLVTYGCLLPSGERRPLLRLRLPASGVGPNGEGVPLPELDLYAQTASMQVRADRSVHYQLRP